MLTAPLQRGTRVSSAQRRSHSLRRHAQLAVHKRRDAAGVRERGAAGDVAAAQQVVREQPVEVLRASSCTHVSHALPHLHSCGRLLLGLSLEAALQRLQASLQRLQRLRLSGGVVWHP